MAHPEEKLAELGLAVPEVAKPVAAYVPGGALGQLRLHLGQLRMRSGELMQPARSATRSHPTRPSSAPSSAPSTPSLRSRPSSATSTTGQADRRGRRFVASTSDFTGQPQVANGASELFGAVFADAGVRAVGGRSARAAAGRAGRGRAGRGVLSRAAGPLPPHLVEQARSTPTARRPPSRATPRPSYSCGGRRPGVGPCDLPAASADVDGLRRRHVRVPRGRGRSARLRRDRRVVGARPRRTGRSGWASTRPRRGRWSVPPCARRSRSRASCWPAPRPATWSPTPPATTGRPTGSRSSPASSRCRRSAHGAVWCCRTDLLGVGQLADPGVRAAPLPHLVLRCLAAGGTADARCRRVVVRELDARTGGRAGCRRQRPDDDAADLPHLPGDRQHGDPGGARRVGRQEHVDMFTPEVIRREGEASCPCPSGSAPGGGNGSADDVVGRGVG